MPVLTVRSLFKQFMSKRTTKNQSFIASIHKTLDNHLMKLDTIKLDVVLTIEDGHSFLSIMKSIQTVLWEMYKLIGTIADTPKATWSQWATNWVFDYDKKKDVGGRNIREVTDTLFRVGRELSGDYYKWWIDATKLKIVDPREQRPTVPNFFSDVLNECFTKCSDTSNTSLLCEICRDTSAGKLMGGLTLWNRMCTVCKKKVALYGTIDNPLCEEHSDNSDNKGQYDFNISNLQYNVVLRTIREIIISVGYYTTLSRELKAKYDSLLAENDTTTSIYSDCKKCQVPYVCKMQDRLDRICLNDSRMSDLFADVKRKEVFYIGYKSLTNGNSSTSAYILKLVDRLSTYVISPQSIVTTLVRLADIIVDGGPISWDIISDVSQFLGTMKGSKILGHARLVEELNKTIAVYGIGMNI